MKRTRNVALFGLLVSTFGATGLALRADTKDPEAALKEIDRWYNGQIKAAEDAGKQVDSAALSREWAARATKAVEGVDSSKLDPAKGLAWARLYQVAQMPKEMIVAASRYLESGPPVKEKYAAHDLLLTGYSEQNDADGLRRVLADIKPPTALDSATLASSAARHYARLIADKYGPKAGLDVIAKVESMVRYADLNSSQRDKQESEYTRAQIALGKSALLEKAGRKAESLGVLEQGVKVLGPGSRSARPLSRKLKLAGLPGSSAPPIKADRVQGEFKGLDAYRGKVVILDFTAHW